MCSIVCMRNNATRAYNRWFNWCVISHILPPSQFVLFSPSSYVSLALLTSFIATYILLTSTINKLTKHTADGRVLSVTALTMSSSCILTGAKAWSCWRHSPQSRIHPLFPAFWQLFGRWPATQTIPCSIFLGRVNTWSMKILWMMILLPLLLQWVNQHQKTNKHQVIVSGDD